MRAEEACSVCGYDDEKYHISTADELTVWADAVNDGDDFSGKTISLDADVDLTDVTWTPVGNGIRDGKSYTGNAFSGTFDGNGYAISGLILENGESVGLFGIVDGGTIKNVKLTDVNINAADGENVGAAVAVLTGGGIVDNVTVTGTVSGKEGVGGIVGRMLVNGIVQNCINEATVTQTGASDSAGGIVGKAYYTETDKEMTISDCTNKGTVTSDYAAGGIVGFSAANVTDCANEGTISGGLEAGGIVGEQTNYGEISGNTNSGDISSSKSGGIIGWVRYQNNPTGYGNNEVITVTENTNSGTITSDDAAQSSAGGIIGLAYNQAIVTGNHNTAATISAGTFAAGIVGAIQQETGNMDIADAKFVISGNATTTAIDDITAACTDLYVYNNDPSNPDFAAVENNGEKLVAKIGDAYYPSVTSAINDAEDGATINVLPGTIDEYINPWGSDSTHASEKSITILGANAANDPNGDSWDADNETVLTGGMYLGYDDAHCSETVITVKGITFKEKGLLISGQESVVVENNKFEDITDCVSTAATANENAVSVTGQTYQDKDGSAVIKNNYISGAASQGINLRDSKTVTIEGNYIADTNHNAITIANGADGSIVSVTDNILSDWGTGGEGRALRAAFAGNAAVTFTGNTMTHDAAPEEFVKITGADSVEIADSVWNDAEVNPVTDYVAEGVPYLLAEGAVITIDGAPQVLAGTAEEIKAALAAASDNTVIYLKDNTTYDSFHLMFKAQLTAKNVTLLGGEGTVLNGLTFYDAGANNQANSVEVDGFTVKNVTLCYLCRQPES